MKRCVTLIILPLILLAACSAQPKQATLYEQIGGEQGVTEIVNHLVQNIGHDKQIFHYFAEANVTRFKKLLTLHLCAITDGPCVYDGDAMEQIHDGMQITEKDFNHLVDLLIDAMYQSGVSHPLQNQVLARLAPLRSHIIYR